MQRCSGLLQHELSLLYAVKMCFDLESRCQRQMELDLQASWSVPCQVLWVLWFKETWKSALELGMYQRKLGVRHQNVGYK